MTCQPYNIKIVECNDFALLLPLKKRTYVASTPIDEDIDATALADVVLTIGGKEYATELGLDGVRAIVTDKPARGTYDILLTANYHGSTIQAAYFEALTIVAWNYQSDAEQYIQGSPIVLQSAYVIGGVLTDAELQALKEQYIQATADLRAAEQAAQAAKEAFDAKAEMLDGVAQEHTLTEGVAAIRRDIDGMHVSELAKQGSDPYATLSATQGYAQSAASDAAAAKTAAQAITGYALQGENSTATNTVIAALIGYTIQEIDGV